MLALMAAERGALGVVLGDNVEEARLIKSTLKGKQGRDVERYNYMNILL